MNDVTKHPPHVSIIVCTRNRPDFIAPCLQSLLDQSYDDLEIIFVDQSTNGMTESIVTSLGKTGDDRVRYHRSNTVGLSTSRNIGLRLSRGEIIAFTDDDVIATRNWAENLVAEYGQHPQVTLLFGKVSPLNESTESETSFCVMEKEESRLYSHTNPNPYGIGGGNNMTLRRRALDQIGYFDERFGAGSRLRGAEDVDYIYRCFLADQDVFYSHLPVVHHRQWRNEEETNATSRAYNLANAALIAKHVLAGSRGALHILQYRLWHYSLSAFFGAVRQGKPHLISWGFRSLIDHLRGVFAYLQY